MKTHKHMYVDFAFYDSTGIERFLEKQAAKGWLLESTGGLFWRFVRTKTRGLRYCVTFFPEIIDLDQGASEDHMRFLEYCARDGWHFVDTVDCMQIFYSERVESTPIESDPLDRMETIHSTLKEKYLIPFIAVIVLVVVETALMVLSACYSETVWEFVRKLIVCLLLTSSLIPHSFNSIQYFCWKRKAEKEARLYGTFSETKSIPYLTTIFVAVYGCSLLVFLIFDTTITDFWLRIGGVLAMTIIYLTGLHFRGKKKNEVISKLKTQIQTEI